MQRLERISSSKETADDWRWAVRGLADQALRNNVQGAIAERKNYPRKELVALLTDPQLAVRLGALELLEQAAGDTYGYNAWAKPSAGSSTGAHGEEGDPRNVHALEMWGKWAGSSGKVKADGLVLSGEQLQGYIRDIISANPDRKMRAVRMLEPHGMKAVASIQEFIVNNKGLPKSNLINLKEAQYHLVLFRSAGENASVLARDLTRGNRDQQLGAISALKKIGFLGIPIVRDYLRSPDALVRETAVDTILSLGGTQAVPLVIPELKKEKDVNVIHAAMRRFREVGGEEVKKLVITYLDHESEDMVVSALQSLSKLSDDDSSRNLLRSHRSSSGSKKDGEQSKKVIGLLKDPRWRVRSAALEYVTSTQLKGAGDQVVALLTDEDEFVRSHAISAAVALRLTSAKKKLQSMFLTDDEMIAPVTKAFTSMEIVLPDDLVAHLDARAPDVIVGAIRAMDKDEKPYLQRIARYAEHKNLDVACAALRVLADDDDKLKFPFVANYLTTALQSGSKEKTAAVLDSLDLPDRSNIDPSLMRVFGSGIGEKTVLDPLYDAFLKPLDAAREEKVKAIKLKPASGPGATGGLVTLKNTLAKLAEDWDTAPENGFRAAFLLGKAGDDRGLVVMMKNYARLTTSQRAAIADRFYSLRSKEATPLIIALMRDELSEIRSNAAERAFNVRENLHLIERALAEVVRKGAKIQPHEFYGYGLERAATEGGSKRLMLGWARDVLKSDSGSDELKVLALIVIRHNVSQSDEKLVEPYISSGNQWLRRAAWFAMGKGRLSWLNKNVHKITTEQSAQVRKALPVSVGMTEGTWNHQFTDTFTAADRSWSSTRRRIRLTTEVEQVIRDLAEKDPSPEVRFESWFTLMSHGKTIDLDTFITLIAQQPKGAAVSKRLADYLERNYRRMGKGMRPLLAYADIKHISSSTVGAVMHHFATGDSRASFNSFASLAKAAESSGDPQITEGGENPEELARLRKHLKVIVFYKPGCKECDKAEGHLADLKSGFPLLEIERRNILDQDDLLINRALCDRFQTSGSGKTPSMFAQAGAAIAPNVKPEQLADLLQRTMEMRDDPAWAEFDEAEMEVAKENVEETFSSMTMTIVILGGLLDGVNPCAFATIIFFLSYLQVAKRTPREILAVGISFILAVFLAYFSVGIAFHAFIEKLQGLPGFGLARTVMTWVFAGFALLVAVLSLRDGIRASRGNMGDMTLQLPGFLKDRIRGTIRSRARARNYVIAAFITGIIISFLELACTGQVYAPIVYQIQQGKVDAYFYLLIYNLAFILPLVTIFVLAYRGMTSDALVQFQQKHTAAVKYATAALFLLLTVVILFGDRLVSHG